jgi:hypothetical protein
MSAKGKGKNVDTAFITSGEPTDIGQIILI